jgi:integrase
MMARRANGEGSLYQRADGRWVAELDLGYANGHRRRRPLYGRTQAEVRAKLTAARHELDQGIEPPDERLTVGQYLHRWLSDTVAPHRRPRTCESYSYLVTRHIEPTLGRERLARLTPGQVQRLEAQKLAGGLSPRTVQYLHAVLRKALGDAVRTGLVPRNVASLVEAPRVRRTEVQPLTPEQSRAFLEAVEGSPDRPLYVVAMALGLRRGEVLALRWEDVDLDAATLTVRHSLREVPGGSYALDEPKTERSRRTLALPLFVVDALRTHHTAQARVRLAAGEGWHDDGYVFTTDVGLPLHGRVVLHRFQRALRAAGLPRLRFHDLRHGAASLLVAQHVDLKVVQEVLGHAQLATTAEIYAHLLPEARREAAGRMQDILVPVAAVS